jgi:hypothetical protein
MFLNMGKKFLLLFYTSCSFQCWDSEDDLKLLFWWVEHFWSTAFLQPNISDTDITNLLDTVSHKIAPNSIAPSPERWNWASWQDEMRVYWRLNNIWEFINSPDELMGRESKSPVTYKGLQNCMCVCMHVCFNEVLLIFVKTILDAYTCM